MKKQLIGLGIVALLFGGAGSADATLDFITTDVLLDNETNLYWYRDLTHWVEQTYEQQQSAISLFETIDPMQSDWRMANYSEMESLFGNDVSSLTAGFVPTYIQNSDNIFWHGRYDHEATAVNFNYDPSISQHADGELGSISGWEVAILNGFAEDDTYTSSTMGAWVVADASVTDPAAPVPEPTTMLLFGAGLVGLAGSSLRKKKK